MKIMKDNKINNSPVSFGPGYRDFSAIREINFCPICSSSEPDIVLEELPTEQFRFEKNGTEEGEYVRIRSDISMLLHAADMAKKYGSNFVQSMIDMRRPKSTSLQSQMDQMSDSQILDTVKSRHLQSPSELIACLSISWIWLILLSRRLNVFLLRVNLNLLNLNLLNLNLNNYGIF